MNALRSVFAELGAAIDLLEDAVAELTVPDGNPTMLTGRPQRPVLRVEGAAPHGANPPDPEALR